MHVLNAVTRTNIAIFKELVESVGLLIGECDQGVKFVMETRNSFQHQRKEGSHGTNDYVFRMENSEKEGKDPSMAKAWRFAFSQSH